MTLQLGRRNKHTPDPGDSHDSTHRCVQVEAGAQLQVALQARDTAGNSGTWGGVDLTTVHAEVLGQDDGGEYVAVGLSATLEDDQRTLQLSAQVLKAGSYLLSVSIEGRVPASFPRALQVCDSLNCPPLQRASFPRIVQGWLHACRRGCVACSDAGGVHDGWRLPCVRRF